MWDFPEPFSMLTLFIICLFYGKSYNICYEPYAYIYNKTVGCNKKGHFWLVHKLKAIWGNAQTRTTLFFLIPLRPSRIISGWCFMKDATLIIMPIERLGVSFGHWLMWRATVLSLL